jgi:hypothetical protein
MREKQVFGPVDVEITPGFTRADLEFYRINHFRPSFTVWIFLNDPKVTVGNASVDRPSFAGSFSIFGHQRCVGDEGHCEVHTEARRFDDRPSHPLTRAFKRVIVTDALRRCVPESGHGAGSDDAAAAPVTVTAVAAAAADEDFEFDGKLLDFSGLQLTTFA